MKYSRAPGIEGLVYNRTPDVLRHGRLGSACCWLRSRCCWLRSRCCWLLLPLPLPPPCWLLPTPPLVLPLTLPPTSSGTLLTTAATVLPLTLPPTVEPRLEPRPAVDEASDALAEAPPAKRGAAEKLKRVVARIPVLIMCFFRMFYLKGLQFEASSNNANQANAIARVVCQVSCTNNYGYRQIANRECF